MSEYVTQLEGQRSISWRWRVFLNISNVSNTELQLAEAAFDALAAKSRFRRSGADNLTAAKSIYHAAR